VLTMAVGHSDDVDPKDAIAQAIEGCRSRLGDATPQAALLLSAFESFDPSMVEAVRDAFPGIDVVGSTSAAEMSSTGGFGEDSIVLACFASDDADITAGLGTGLGGDLDAACAAAVRQALARATRAPKVCIVLLDGFIADPQRALDAIASGLPPGVAILGGTSSRSDFATVTPTYQFCNDVVAEDGVAILLFSGPIVHAVAVGTGWKTIGPKGVVTGSGFGAIDEIDGRPAIEFLARYIDRTGPATYGNPLAVFEEGATEFYLRAIQPSDSAAGSIAMAGSIPIGASVQLTTAGTDEVLAGTAGALRGVLADFGAKPPEAALIFSCAVRKFVLGSRTHVEAELASSILGPSVPFAGLYCFGEVGPVGGTPTSRFLNETFVALLLGT